MEKLKAPLYFSRKREDIPFADFYNQGYHMLFIDLDNTLMEDYAKKADDQAKAFIQKRQEEGFSICILSNGAAYRIQGIAEELGLPYIAPARKPSTEKLREYCEKMAIDLSTCMLLGDQYSSDGLCAKNLGILGILISPLSKKERWHIRWKRPIERWLIPYYTEALPKKN